MKKILFLPAFLLIFAQVHSQSTDTVRKLGAQLIGKDSVIIYLNKYYEVIEPTCATIVRHAHYDLTKKCFTGKFKDTSPKDSSLILSEGSYSADGLKNGLFVLNYLDGKVHAKGFFQNNKYEGEWMFYSATGQLKERANFKDGKYQGKFELYNDDGSPNTFMTIKSSECIITDFWTPDGKKSVDNGNGYYTSLSKTPVPWEGSLSNGVPDGLWTFQISDNIYGSEVFKKGRFTKGRNQSPLRLIDYDDKSRINFLPDAVPHLIVQDAERFNVSITLCDGTNYGKAGNNYYQIFDNGPLTHIFITPLKGATVRRTP